MDKFGPMMINYFTEKNFKDPALEMLTFSALIEGCAILLVLAYPGMEFPDDLLQKYEERVIEMFTRKPY
jgi:hypothetical protein